MSCRRAKLLPKTFRLPSMQSPLVGIDSDNMSVVINSYFSLSSIAMAIRTEGRATAASLYSHPELSKILQRLSSPPEQAASIICRSACFHNWESDLQVNGACKLLLECMEEWARYRSCFVLG